jgi:lysophospholipase L1-like esterase
MRKALLVSGWLLFVFVLLQAAGFVFYRLEVSKPISGYGYPDGLVVAHPDLGYHYQPGFSGHFKGAAYQDIAIEINEQGFRDRGFKPAPGDGQRIAVLGDSVVFGAGVEQADRFTECLEDAARASGQPRRLLNLGVNAYSFGHYVKLAELDFLGSEPDAVLVGVTLNDFEPMHDVGPARRMRRHADEWHKPLWIARIQERLGRTYAARFLNEIKTRLTYALMNADEREEYHTKWMRTVVSGWQADENRQRFETDLDALVGLLQDANIPFGFIIFPELNALLAPAEFDLPRQLVRKLLDQRGLPYCDPYDDFAKQSDLTSLFLQRDSVHFTPKGHQVLCLAIERCIEQQGLAGISSAGTAETAPATPR